MLRTGTRLLNTKSGQICWRDAMVMREFIYTGDGNFSGLYIRFADRVARQMDCKWFVAFGWRPVLFHVILHSFSAP